jgi:hypothetical protein
MSGAARGQASAAVELAALVRESVAAGAARDVLHLRAAALGPALRRPHRRRLLRDILDHALPPSRTRVFDLPNGDLVAVARAIAPGLDEAEDILLRGLDAAGEAGDAVRRLRLPEEAAQLLTAAAEALGLQPGPDSAATSIPTAPLGSAELAAAERCLAAADLEALTLVQTVCRLPEGGPPEPAWEDRRVNWPALASALLPDRDLAAMPGLMRRLSRAAELRLLAELARPASQLAWRPVGIALSPATLGSAAFARFAEALPAGRAAQVTIGLRGADLLADPGAAPRLVQALRGRGMRVALDDAAPGLLTLLPPERLAPDIVRLRWTPGLPGAEPAALERLLDATPEGVVLAGVDRPAAIAWGWEAGIRLFQGPLVERRRRL